MILTERFDMLVKIYYSPLFKRKYKRARPPPPTPPPTKQKTHKKQKTTTKNPKQNKQPPNIQITEEKGTTIISIYIYI